MEGFTDVVTGEARRGFMDVVSELEQRFPKPDEIIKHVDLVVMRRNTDEEQPVSNLYYDEAYFVDTPLIEISSTNIRERINSNSPISFLVPNTDISHDLPTNSLLLVF